MEHSSKHIQVLQHHDRERLGIIADALRDVGVAPRCIRSFAGQPVPKEMGDALGIIVMGGPQSVYEQGCFPRLGNELRLIEDALKHQKPVLGVCLGSQLLATALGATVYPARTKEIGWNRVTLAESAQSDPLFDSAPRSFVAFHWHGDIFDFPHGPTLLAFSALTANQAFRYGRNVYGVLFHMEVTFSQICAMTESFADELRDAGFNGAAIRLNAHTHLPALQQIGRTVFHRWVALLR